MLAIADLLRLLPVLYAVLSVLNNLLMITGCVFVSLGLFRVEPRRHPLPYIAVLLLNTLVGVLRPSAFLADNLLYEQLWSTAGMLLPYACMFLIFRRKGVWKPLLVAVGYTFVEAIKYILLILFFHYDNDNINDPLETLLEFLIHAVFFLFALLFMARWAKKHELDLHPTRGSVILFCLVAATVAVFIASLALLSSHYTESEQAEFAFLLLNIPLLTATVTVAVAGLVRARARSETYRAQLAAQVQYYAMMEKMNEDLRLFRHDLPKKVRPLIAYLDDDRRDDAKEIAEQLGGFVDHMGVRFNTGNYRLDTVLFCQQQLAQKYNIRIVFPFGNAFPADGIDPDDLYTIFPNALDNAIEATRKTDGDRTITIRSKVRGDTVYISIENPVAGEVTLRHGEPQTDKADKSRHGYGFRSMKKAAAHYGDDNLTVSVKDGVFTLQMALRFQQPETA